MRSSRPFILIPLLISGDHPFGGSRDGQDHTRSVRDEAKRGKPGGVPSPKTFCRFRSSSSRIRYNIAHLRASLAAEERQRFFAAGLFKGGDVLESTDRQTQVEFGKKRPEVMSQALCAAVGQG